MKKIILESINEKNLKEFKALIKRYETITLDEIEECVKVYYFFNDEIAQALTGFGVTETCTLCLAVNHKCKYCVFYAGSDYCMQEENEETYYRIAYAKTPRELLSAFRARAKHMKTLII